MPYGIHHQTIPSCLVLVGILFFILLLPLLPVLIVSSIPLYGFSPLSTVQFLTFRFFFQLLLEPPNHAGLSQCIYMESSYWLHASLHQCLPLTKKRSEALLASLHDFTSSMLLAFLLSISMWSVWLLVFPSGDLHVCLWISLWRKQVEDTTMFFAAAKSTRLCPLLFMFKCVLCLPITP